MDTYHVIHALCVKLDHRDAAASLVKKLVKENWLENVNDLRYVPRRRFEQWGMPLKLIHELNDYFDDMDATAAHQGISSFFNYEIRPGLSWLAGGTGFLQKLRDDAEKRRHPQVYAAKVIQQWWRRCRAERLLADTEGAVEEWLCKDDFAVPGERQARERRLRRAQEKLRRFVRRWRKARQEKRSKSGGGTASRAASRAAARASRQNDISPFEVTRKEGELKDDPGSIAVALWRLNNGVLKDCEVTRLLWRIGAAVHRSQEEMEPYAHRLVTLNWLENISDLDLIEEQNWEDWAFPEKIVVLIKLELQEQADETMFQGINQAARGFTSFFSGAWMGSMFQSHNQDETDVISETESNAGSDIRQKV